MSMNSDGARKWAHLTKQNLGKSIAIVLDGFVYSYPTVQSEITGGNSQITGNFTTEEAQDLANVLKSGKLPAPATIVEDTVVGPSLGQEAIESGLLSFLIAFIAVLVYMVVFYGVRAGLTADFALICNLFFIVHAHRRNTAAQRVYFVITEPLEQMCQQYHINCAWVPSMLDLGKACGIEVGTAAAAAID